jgi:hypothetical protein
MLLRERVHDVYEFLCNEVDYDLMDKWYFDRFGEDLPFETYEEEEDDIPMIIKSMQIDRKRENAFLEVAANLNLVSVYSDFQSGMRPKGSDPSMDRWYERDPDYQIAFNGASPEKLNEDFQKEFIKRSEARKADEQLKLNKPISDRMAAHDRYFSAKLRVMEFGGDDGTLE